MSFSTSIGLGGPEFKSNPFIKQADRVSGTTPGALAAIGNLSRASLERTRHSLSIFGGAVVDLTVSTLQDLRGRQHADIDQILPLIEEDQV